MCYRCLGIVVFYGICNVYGLRSSYGCDTVSVWSLLYKDSDFCLVSLVFLIEICIISMVGSQEAHEGGYV